MGKRKRDVNKVIVIGLPEGTDDEALEAMFSEVGKVYAAHVVGLDEETGRSRGYGFITFADAEACQLAVEKMHKTVLGDGRVINVRLVEERDKKTEALGKDANKVIVAGLSQSMTDDRLQRMCEDFGLVLKASVVRNPTTGKSKGYGFVTFTNRACQQACIAALDKRELGGGRVLNVRAVEARSSEGNTTSSEGNKARAASLKKSSGDSNVRSSSSASPADSLDGVCHKFQFGKCHRGRSCKWRHEKVPGLRELLEQRKAAKAKKMDSTNQTTDFDSEDELTTGGLGKQQRHEDEKTQSESESNVRMREKNRINTTSKEESDSEDSPKDDSDDEEGDDSTIDIVSTSKEGAKTPFMGLTGFDDDDDDDDDEDEIYRNHQIARGEKKSQHLKSKKSEHQNRCSAGEQKQRQSKTKELKQPSTADGVLGAGTINENLEAEKNRSLSIMKALLQGGD